MSGEGTAVSDGARVVAGRYRLGERIGRGGMGVVWAARDELLGRDVAVKELVPPPGLTAEERDVLRRRSLREARAAARIASPGAVTVHDVVEDQDSTWIVMQHVAAPSLAEELRTKGPLPPYRAARVGLSVLDGLLAAHAVGVVHRDVKPANVLLVGDRGVLTDFGIAALDGDTTLTGTGALVGSPAYISPERARGEPASPASDLWALGATLHAAVEGSAPYERGTAVATLTATVSEPVPEAPHAGPLAPVLRQLLDPDPAARPDGARTRRLLDAVATAPRHAAPPVADRSAVVAGPADHVQRVPVVRAPVLAAAPPVVAPMPEPAVTPVATPAPEPRRAAPPAAAPAPATVSTSASASAPTPTSPPTPPPTPPPTQPPTPPPNPPSSATGAAPLVDRAELRRLARRRRRRRRLGVGLAAVVLLAVAALLATSALRDDGSTGTTGTPAPSAPARATDAAGAAAAPAVPGARAATSSPSPAATTPAPPATPTTAPTPRTTGSPNPGGPALGPAAVPAGFRAYTSSTYSLAHPADWRVTAGSVPERTIFRSPDGSRFLQVEYTTDPSDDPHQDWVDYEPDVASRFARYERLSLDRTTFDGWPASDWQFTWRTESGRDLRVLNRGVLVSPDYGFGLYWSVPEDEWEERLPEFEAIASSFRVR